MSLRHLTSHAIRASLLLAVSFFWIGQAAADSHNDKLILRKAGGTATGNVTNIVSKITPMGGGPTMTAKTFDRNGSVKIPTSEGKDKSKVKHGGPESGFDTKSSGKVKKASVKRGGSLVIYKGAGKQTTFDGEGTYKGGGKATSKIKGKKVKSTGSVEGKRTQPDGDKEETKAKIDGKSKF